MCLLVLAWRTHPRFPLIIAANRDEFHARPAAPLAPWTDIDGLVGGRDLEAGGAWFAVGSHDRVGIVTNFREFGRPRRSAPSRGHLIPAYLAGPHAAGEYLEAIEADAPGYAGFNLLLADQHSLWYASNRADQFARRLDPGIYGLSNEFLDTPWPKLVRVRQKFEAILASSKTDEPDAFAAELFAMLADRDMEPPETLAPGALSPEWARKLSAPFVLDSGFGTRCSTILTISGRGERRIIERRFDADGSQTRQSEHLLNGASDG